MAVEWVDKIKSVDGGSIPVVKRDSGTRIGRIDNSDQTIPQRRRSDDSTSKSCESLALSSRYTRWTWATRPSLAYSAMSLGYGTHAGAVIKGVGRDAGHERPSAVIR
jgi:hypothetical protein